MPTRGYRRSAAYRCGKNGTAYAVEIPRFPAGTEVRYYVEARAVESSETTTFFPTKAEFEPLTFPRDSTNCQAFGCHN